MATVAEVMNRDVLAVDPTASIGEAAEKMAAAPTAAVGHANLKDPAQDPQMASIVDGLAKRLQANPDDGEGWAMLGRSSGGRALRRQICSPTNMAASSGADSRLAKVDQTESGANSHRMAEISALIRKNNVQATVARRV